MLRSCVNCIYEFTENCDPGVCFDETDSNIEFQEYDYFGRTDHLY